MGFYVYIHTITTRTTQRTRTDLEISICLPLCYIPGGVNHYAYILSRAGITCGGTRPDAVFLCGFYADKKKHEKYYADSMRIRKKGKTYYSYADLMLSYKNTNNYKVFRCWAIINYEQISKNINKYQ